MVVVAAAAAAVVVVAVLAVVVVVSVVVVKGVSTRCGWRSVFRDLLSSACSVCMRAFSVPRAVRVAWRWRRSS
jgi:hypothetical protein